MINFDARIERSKTNQCVHYLRILKFRWYFHPIGNGTSYLPCHQPVISTRRENIQYRVYQMREAVRPKQPTSNRRFLQYRRRGPTIRIGLPPIYLDILSLRGWRAWFNDIAAAKGEAKSSEPFIKCLTAILYLSQTRLPAQQVVDKPLHFRPGSRPFHS
jgi:hypothetical protein